jgi:hypothetical protein
MNPAWERRSHPRHPSGVDGPPFRVRLRAGAKVDLLDVSADGVLIESHTRLAPGAAVDLVLGEGHDHVTLRGVVVHSRVSAIRRRSGIAYRAGVRAPVGSYYSPESAATGDGHLLPGRPDGLFPPAADS